MGMTKEDMRDAGVSVAVRTHLLKASAEYRPPPASSGDGPGDGGGREADARAEPEISVPAAVAAPQIISEFDTPEETKIMSNAVADTADIDFVVEQTGVDRTRAAAALDRHQQPAAAILAIEDEQKAERARAQPPPQLEARQASTAAHKNKNAALSGSAAPGEVGGDLSLRKVLSDGPPSGEEEGGGGGLAADESSGSTSNNTVATAGAVAAGASRRRCAACV